MNREDKIAKARQMRAAGVSLSHIGRTLGVSQGTAWRWTSPPRSTPPRQRPLRYKREPKSASPPPRPSARMQRLAAASARVRSRRAEIKARIVVGELDVREVVIEPPIVLRTTPVLEIVACAPWIGKTRARALLRRVGVDERAVFGWTPPAKRWQLAAAIPKHKPVAGTRRVREKAAA